MQYFENERIRVMNIQKNDPLLIKIEKEEKIEKIEENNTTKKWDNEYISMDIYDTLDRIKSTDIEDSDMYDEDPYDDVEDYDNGVMYCGCIDVCRGRCNGFNLYH